LRLAGGNEAARYEIADFNGVRHRYPPDRR
jgi:hypothetical protein